MGELMERSSSRTLRGRLVAHMLVAGIVLFSYLGLATGLQLMSASRHHGQEIKDTIVSTLDSSAA